MLRRTAAALPGKNPDSVAALAADDGDAAAAAEARSKTAPKAAVATPAPTPAATPQPAATPARRADQHERSGEAVLDYLFGKDRG